MQAVQPFVLKRITAAEARPLRHQVLRPHQPPEACVYPDDEEPSSCHFGVVLDDRVVGIASMYGQGRPGRPEERAWRIRGMAVLAAHRGAGYGKRLLAACLEAAVAADGLLVWCNARETVRGFYEQLGFEVEGDVFDLPGLGPHYAMVRRLDG